MLKIRKDGDKVLRTRCQEVLQPFSAEDKSTVKEMEAYLEKSQDAEYAKAHSIQPGIGLAAPQIGIDKRMFAIFLTDGETTYKYGFINPTILRTSLKKAYLGGGEGCLSVPEKHEGLVYRYYKIVLEGFDVFQDKDITITAYGYLAIAIQHEYDHLDGILYYDRIDKKNPLYHDPSAVEV